MHTGDSADTRRQQRFQRQTPSQEFLQEDYEQNVLGSTAGFFCAVWAGRLMGERLSITLTTWSPASRQNNHHLAISDLGIVVLLVTKLLFIRALVFRYLLRPALKHLETTSSFASRQRAAEYIGRILLALLTTVSAIYMLCRSTSLHSSGISAEEKLFIIGHSAIQLAAAAVGLLESTAPDRVLAQYLNAGSLFSAGMLGYIHIAATLICAQETLAFIRGLSAVAKYFGVSGYGLLHRASTAFSFFALAIAVPWMVHRVAVAAPLEGSKDGGWVLAMRSVFCVSAAVSSLVDLRRLVCADDVRAATELAADDGHKKTQ
ncbi:hypothetical protein LPJ57_002195 [Coemansia sp. RSA 486]|nr:hypothetical protein LPJ57_002195 [Coemansia sp. RSA 486]KAJ2234447.1 hypothetical protein IWW45_003390 [Coemansia sp. RSA 485]